MYFKNLCGLACLFRKSWEVRTHTGIQSESVSGLKIELFLTIPFSLGSLGGTPCYFFFCYYHFSCHLSYWRETVVRVCPNPITRGLFYGVTEQNTESMPDETHDSFKIKILTTLLSVWYGKNRNKLYYSLIIFNEPNVQ